MKAANAIVIDYVTQESSDVIVLSLSDLNNDSLPEDLTPSASGTLFILKKHMLQFIGKHPAV